MENKSIISKNIRDLRLKFGYTQAFIAEILNITPAAVNQYEKDARTIPVTVVEKLALLFNVDEYDLYEENPQKQSVMTSFAFRADEMTPGDLQQINRFKKIISNYLNMSEALQNG
ncbi:protein containing helix-turn-helix domain [Bacteroidales bacterium 6E]|nr:protein containing helix-turn-helix domain [Bacteroidales bacterium 6E]